MYAFLQKHHLEFVNTDPETYLNIHADIKAGATKCW